MKRFIIHENDRWGIRSACLSHIEHLDPSKKWEVMIAEHTMKRSLAQNAFLHAVQIKLICDHTGHDKEEMKDYLLGEAFGWEEYEIMGMKKSRPARRSSSLNTKEFSWFMEWVEAWASNVLGIGLPRPNEQVG